jgi:hypothetical protein
MPSAGEIRQQVDEETERRSRLSVPAFAGGFLYLLSAIIIASTQKGLPTVGVFQGLKPALSGERKPAVSPRAAEVKFISHHAFPVIAGSVIAAIAIIVLVLVLLVLFDATVYRRPASWALARVLTIVGGVGVALGSVAHEVVSMITTHEFAVGHDFSTHAVDQALTKAPAIQIVAYVALLAALALVVGMVTTLLNAQRTGLSPRWLSFLGIFAGILLLVPSGATLQLVPAFWLLMMGLLYAGKWPGGDPPAWADGVSRPWPSRAQMQAERRGLAPAAAGKNADAAPAATPVKSSSRKRRKRGGRG